MTQEEEQYARRLMQAGTVDTSGGHDGPHPPSAASVTPPEPKQAEPEVPEEVDP